MNETIVFILNIFRLVAALFLIVLVLSGGPPKVILALFIIVTLGLLWSLARRI